MTTPPPLPPPGFELVLGSSSWSRAEVLTAAGVPFRVATADIDERALGHRGPDADPAALVLL
ncbi:hypothetical protein HK405_002966, partial [Cladochytrium tenue]